MSEAERPGLAKERTALAWQRTAIALLAVGSGELLGALRSAAPTLLVPVAAVVVASGLAAGAHGRRTYHRRLGGGPEVRPAALRAVGAACTLALAVAAGLALA